MFKCMFKFSGIFLVICALSACTRNASDPGDPKKQLSDYISKSFSINSPTDRQTLASYLTGDAKSRLEAWSDDQFRQAFIDSKRQFVKLAFKEVKPGTADQMSITYEITYLDQGRGHDAKVTNKKLCEMVRDQGKWLISDVRNIKELVEYKNEMALP